jgi:drug/metabolite transporter (DMT)-like permease
LTSIYTVLALIAFSANSILCRLALSGQAIDAASFTSVRLIAGAVTLAALVRGRRAGPVPLPGSWRSAAMLALYAVPFSLAYVSLTAGTGALLLFGAVQMTMLLATILRGERPGALQWIGVTLALGGLVYLVLPGITAPPLVAAVLMVLAGVAWGAYSLLGRGSADPLGETAGNFVRAVPFALGASVLMLGDLHIESTGLLLAIASGAVASGLGYVIWYAALRSLSGFSASIVQLAGPVLAAAGGVVLLGERITPRLVLAGGLVLGGIALALVGQNARRSGSMSDLECGHELVGGRKPVGR